MFQHATWVLEEKMITEETSLAAPALTSWKGKLYLAWTGSDLHLNTMVSTDGREFEGKCRHPYTSSMSEMIMTTTAGITRNETRTRALPPALASSAGGLHVAWTEFDQHLRVVQAEVPSAAPIRLEERSGVAPALAPFRDELALAWTGTGRHLNIMVSHGGSFDGGPLRLEETSTRSPALCSLGDELALVWAGTDRHLNVMVSRGGVFEGQPLRLEETTADAPAACSVGPDLVLAWTGTDRHLNVIVSQGGVFEGQPLQLEETSSMAPAICPAFGSVALAWIGTDSHLSTGLLRSTAGRQGDSSAPA